MRKGIGFIGICMIGMVLLGGCGKTTEVSETAQSAEESAIETTTEMTQESSKEEITMNVTSKSINSDGRFLTVCSKSGGNKSPELTWDAIPEASEYAVYMYDRSAGQWLHFKETGVTETHFDEGQFVNKGEGYVGPYPPASTGDHEYEIVVYALKQAPDEVGGTLDSMCKVENVEKKLDTAGGAEGNIICSFGVSGLFANGDENQ